MLCPKPWDTQCRLSELCNVKLILLATYFPVHMVLNKHMAESSHLPWCTSQWPYHIHWDTIHLIRCHPNSQEKTQHIHSLVFMSNLVSLSKIQVEWRFWWSLGIYLLIIHSSAKKPESSEELCCPEIKGWVGEANERHLSKNLPWGIVTGHRGPPSTHTWWECTLTVAISTHVMKILRGRDCGAHYQSGWLIWKYKGFLEVVSMKLVTHLLKKCHVWYHLPLLGRDPHPASTWRPHVFYT